MLKQLSILFLVALAAIFTGCTEFPIDPIGGGDDPDVTGREIPFETIIRTQGYGSVFTERQQIVVGNQAEWQDLWAKLHHGIVLVPEAPAVDFHTSTVVAVLQGTQLTGGYDAEVTNITENEKGMRVSFVETVPGIDCPTTSALTSPYHIVKIAKTNEAIDFQGATLMENCNGTIRR